ncbi:hypothetical protein I4U23_022437 [Adineta vaga]|nr:hypothetical protein I4U23_022437 [Adineta vaga]
MDNQQCSETITAGTKYFLDNLIVLVAFLITKISVHFTEDFDNNYQSFIGSLIEYVDEFFDSYKEYTACKVQKLIIEHILSIATNLTDKTSLIPIFIKAKYADKTVKWVEQSSFSNYIDGFGENIVGIVYNLSRHRKGLKALRECKTLDVLKNQKSFIMKTKNETLIGLFGMLLIALPRNDDEEKDNEKIILKVSNSLYSKSVLAAKEDNWRFDGCHLSEYLYSLQNAFSNITIIQNILGDSEHVKKDRIQFFRERFCSIYGILFNEDESDLDKLVVKSLLNIFLCISNYEQYRSELRDDLFLYTLIEILAKQHKQGVAKRIWSNLNIVKPTKVLLDKIKQEKTPKIYISYNWADEKFCRSFVDFLHQNISIPIWVDYEETDENEDPWDYVALAIESATIVIMLASSFYANSKHNHQELTYTLEKIKSSTEKKHFIVVVIEDKFRFTPLRMNNLLEIDETISYDENPENLARKVADLEVLSKDNKQTFVSCSPHIVTQSSICILM